VARSYSAAMATHTSTQAVSEAVGGYNGERAVAQEVANAFHNVLSSLTKLRRPSRLADAVTFRAARCEQHCSKCSVCLDTNEAANGGCTVPRYQMWPAALRRAASSRTVAEEVNQLLR
jgi:hypothetical protein